jgi:ribosomal protein S18 acetylase RimI-like enzyme
MSAEQLTATDRDAVGRLWADAGLTRPWNDPAEDFDRAIGGDTSAVLGLRREGRVVATAMVGHDGHRGWVYYVAVDAAYRDQGLGAEIMAAAEQWLAAHGAVKVQLMVRIGNERVLGFYEHLGYEDAETTVLARWLRPPPQEAT